MNILSIIKLVISAVLESLTPEKAREVADKILDKIEDSFEDSSNKWDDLLLPVIKKVIREPFGIPDNDDG